MTAQILAVAIFLGMFILIVMEKFEKYIITLVSVFVLGERREKLRRIMEIRGGMICVCINSTPLGVERAARLIEDYIEYRFGEQES